VHRRTWKRLAVVAAGIACGAVALWLYHGSTALVLRAERVRLPHLAPGDDGLRVAVLSDPHFDGSDGDRAAMIAERINRLRPDLILLLGDFINGDPDPRRSLPMEQLARFVGSLRARCGVFAVTGNHELWYDRGEVLRAVAAGGAADLTNRSVVIRTPSGNALALAGLPDYTTELPAPCPDLPAGLPALILMHDPNSARFVPPATGLILAGHTHGGQIRLWPEGGADSSLRLLMARLMGWLGMIPPWKRPCALFDRGFMEYRGRRLFITSGAGGNRVKLRVFCPPELVLLELRGAGSAAGEKPFAPVREI